MHNNDIRAVNNALKYSDNIKAYQNYIKLIAYLVKVLGLPDNAISYSLILGELTRRGLFSKNGTFAYNNGKNGEIDGFLGINVIKGIGNYKHMANFQNDVLTRNNVASSILFCDLATNISEPGKSVVPNYAVSLIEYRGTLYGYDAYRNKLLTFGADGNLHPIYADGTEHFEYIPIADIAIDDFAFSKNVSLLEMLDKFKGNKIITPEEYRYICEDMKRNIKRNAKYDLFKDFRRSSVRHIEGITRGLK